MLICRRGMGRLGDTCERCDARTALGQHNNMDLDPVLLLPCLFLIRVLPLLPPSTIHCTLGLSQINISSEDIPECSPCFNNQTADDNISAQNFATSGK